MSDSRDPIAWLRRAEADDLSMENNLRAADIPWEPVAYAAQQTAEKALKAFLLHAGTIPPKTHDVERLRADCVALGFRGDDLIADCTLLSSLTLGARYPADEPMDDEVFVRHAIAAARRILSRVRESLMSGPG